MNLNVTRPPTDLIKSATAQTFDSLVLQGAGPMIVEFMTYGCVHCRTIEPILREVAQKLGTDATLIRVNVAVEAELEERFEISGTPTLIMFRDGQQVGRFEGPSPTFANVLELVSETFGS